MQFDVLLARLARVLVCVNGVPMRNMSVMRSRFVVAVADVFCRGAMMLGGLFVMLRRLLVQFLQLFHDRSSVNI